MSSVDEVPRLGFATEVELFVCAVVEPEAMAGGGTLPSPLGPSILPLLPSSSIVLKPVGVEAPVPAELEGTLFELNPLLIDPAIWKGLFRPAEASLLNEGFELELGAEGVGVAAPDCPPFSVIALLLELLASTPRAPVV